MIFIFLKKEKFEAKHNLQKKSFPLQNQIINT